MPEIRKKIIVGMSGGVDSSLAALLLKQAGHDVEGVCMAIYNSSGTAQKLPGHGCYDCDEEKDISTARRICEQVGIPFHVYDCSSDYRRYVLDYFRSEYMSGRTPNPCVRCNHFMKFGVLNKMAADDGIKFDFFATGHYARVSFSPEKQAFLLKKGLDDKKDQSYFLYRLTQEQLSKTLFPLGKYTKTEVRALAERNGLPVHDKPDSQDFYSGDYADLLNAAPKEGFIVLSDGRRLGRHKGFWNYTVGQRKGLGIAYPEPLYVVELDAERNEVIVAPESETFRTACRAEDLSWTAGAPKAGSVLTAKVRSAQAPKEVTVTHLSETEMTLEFTEPQKAVTPGQSVVLYDGDIVLGGGIIGRS